MRDRCPILRKSRHRVPLLFITSYYQVVDDEAGAINELFLWELGFSGHLFKEELMDQFQDPDIAPAEMCMILATLFALSDIYCLGTNIITQSGECPKRLPYQRPPVSEFYQWIKKPRDLHHGWDVIETLICSFQAVFAPREDGTTFAAVY